MDANIAFMHLNIVLYGNWQMLFKHPQETIANQPLNILLEFLSP